MSIQTVDNSVQKWSNMWISIVCIHMSIQTNSHKNQNLCSVKHNNGTLDKTQKTCYTYCIVRMFFPKLKMHIIEDVRAHPFCPTSRSAQTHHSGLSP